MLGTATEAAWPTAGPAHWDTGITSCVSQQIIHLNAAWSSLAPLPSLPGSSIIHFISPPHSFFLFVSSSVYLNFSLRLFSGHSLDTHFKPLDDSNGVLQRTNVLCTLR